MALFHQIRKTSTNEEIQKRQEKALSERAKAVEPVAALQKALEKRGRKPDPNAKQLLTLRLDKDVIEHFRSNGDGWQTRMNEALRKAAGL